VEFNSAIIYRRLLLMLVSREWNWTNTQHSSFDKRR